MTTRPTTRAAKPAARRLVLLALLPLACSRYDGVSDADRLAMKRQSATEDLEKAGAEVTVSRFSLGSGYKVVLRGKPVSNELLEELKRLGGYIGELDLSKSTITDDQLDIINRIEIGSLIIKLDLSHTGITDAGLDKLTNQVALKELDVTGTKVTPAGVERLKKRRAERPQNLVKTTNVKM